MLLGHGFDTDDVCGLGSEFRGLRWLIHRKSFIFKSEINRKPRKRSSQPISPTQQSLSPTASTSSRFTSATFAASCTSGSLPSCPARATVTVPTRAESPPLRYTGPNLVVAHPMATSDIFSCLGIGPYFMERGHGDILRPIDPYKVDKGCSYPDPEECEPTFSSDLVA